MAKTYTAAATAIAGQVYSAAAHNVIVTDVNNFIVPPSVCVQRTAGTAYTNGSVVTWDTTAGWDTDGMFSAGSPTLVTVQTTGLYLISWVLRVTCTTASMTAIRPYVQIDAGSSANYVSYPSDTTTSAYCTGSFTASLTAASTVKMYIDLAGGGTYTLAGSSSVDSTRSRMILTWIGRTS